LTSIWRVTVQYGDFEAVIVEAVIVKKWSSVEEPWAAWGHYRILRLQ
jgi:hypothetical protein